MKERDAVRLGRRIASRRRNLGIGLRTLAERVGIDHTWLHRLERGEFAEPDPAKVSRVLDALALTPGRQVGHELASRLPDMRAYFRAKYELTPEQINQVERYVQRLRRSR
jgi:transcriptional regulator with XRE-family HTH domain